MIVYYMRGKHGHSCAGATHMTKVSVKRTILFLQCSIAVQLSGPALFKEIDTAASGRVGESVDFYCKIT